MCFPADTDRGWALCLQGLGVSLLDPILRSNCDYTRAPEPVLVTCGPSSKGWGGWGGGLVYGASSIAISEQSKAVTIM